MSAEVLEKVKPLEARSGNFLIRYAVAESDTPDEYNVGIDADVYEVAEWTPDGTPIFFHFDGPAAFSKGPVTDVHHPSVKPEFSMTTYYDGQSHIMSRGLLEFSGMAGFDAVRECVRFVYEDLCEKHKVGD